MSVLTQLIVLVVAHYVGDFPLQGTFLAQVKRERLYILVAHALIYAGTIALALWLVGRYSDWKFFAVLGTHVVVDFWKTRQPADAAHWHLIYYDQAAHLAINLALWLV